MSNRLPLPVFGDAPSSSPGLGFAPYVKALADAVRGATPARLTIGLYGRWGTGKSTLLNALGSELAQERKTLVVTFDAWRHERAQHIVVPLLHAVLKAAEARDDFAKVRARLATFIAALMASLDFTGFGVKVSPRSFLERWRDGSSPTVRLDAEFTRPFEELEQLPGALGGRRIVVLVDDLDRCSPSKVVDLLEAMKLIMDIEGFIFILAIDYDVLVEAIAEKYPHVSGHSFVEKLVQVPFRVPRPDLTTERAMKELFPGGWKLISENDASLAETFPRISELALDANPRQTKRLMNAFLLLSRILDLKGIRVSSVVLLAIVGLQIAWPSWYQQVLEETLRGTARPFDPLVGSDDPSLKVYAQAFLSEDVDPAVLRQVFLLASTVDSPEPLQEPRSADPLGGEGIDGEASNPIYPPVKAISAMSMVGFGPLVSPPEGRPSRRR